MANILPRSNPLSQCRRFTALKGRKKNGGKNALL
jgi:hypothetical protein